MLLESLPKLADTEKDLNAVTDNEIEQTNLNKLDMENDDDAETGTDSIC